MEISGGRTNTKKVRKQAWKHQAMEDMETLSWPSAETPRRLGLETPGNKRREDISQAWKHQAMDSIETSAVLCLYYVEDYSNLFAL